MLTFETPQPAHFWYFAFLNDEKIIFGWTTLCTRTSSRKGPSSNRNVQNRNVRCLNSRKIVPDLSVCAGVSINFWPNRLVPSCLSYLCKKNVSKSFELGSLTMLSCDALNKLSVTPAYFKRSYLHLCHHRNGAVSQIRFELKEN